MRQLKIALNQRIFIKQSRKVYEEYMKNISIEKDIILDAREEGLEAGYNKGIEKGIEKGTIDVAIKMIDSGLDVKSIVDLTGLSEGKILSLKINRK